jgi:hypothetical protein
MESDYVPPSVTEYGDVTELTRGNMQGEHWDGVIYIEFFPPDITVGKEDIS